MKKKRTRALEITKDVKLRVWERDDHKCIFCGKPVEWNMADSHFKKRSHGGLGIEENIMTNCPECHHMFDDTKYRKLMMPRAEQYLRSKYPNWSDELISYKKRGEL